VSAVAGTPRPEDVTIAGDLPHIPHPENDITPASKLQNEPISLFSVLWTSAIVGKRADMSEGDLR
jgi:hypothetical protein